MGGEWVKIGAGEGVFYRLANSLGVLVNLALQTDNLESPIKKPPYLVANIRVTDAGKFQ